MIKKRNLGFTIFDLFALIFLIVIILVISIPFVLEMVDNFEKKFLIFKANKIVKTVEKNNLDEYQIYIFKNKKDVSEKKLKYYGFKPENGVVIINDIGEIAFAFQEGKYCVQKNYKDKELVVSEKSAVECKIPFDDGSGASIPVLKSGMIPIVWNGENWVKADISSEWYNYNEKRWANAALVTYPTRIKYMNDEPGTIVYEKDILAYFVWIPRYKYKIFNYDSQLIEAQEIEIEFESKDSQKSIGNNNGEWLTHPAFTFGDLELDGIWVGKFETTGTRSKPTIKPNMKSLTIHNIGKQFNIAKIFNETEVYGLTSTDEVHMMKNTEWGAVAYLTHSKYGKNDEVWVNPSREYITGCAGDDVSVSMTKECLYPYNTSYGQQASTTGNIYGIYDMSGGTSEYVMGGMYNSDQSEILLSLAVFDNINDSSMSKYIDKYKYGITSQDQAAYNRRILGDATGETRSWYEDNAEFIKDNISRQGYGYYWFIRGGYYNDKTKAGIFSFSVQDGGANKYNGFRVVIPGI